ncbi:NUDIX domain-containing protein [Streptomyces sp. NBRC 109706]|uniref:NUDIX domain-containing protein n=1 Tax=Streptomyces sp. NBRC 109706 TaxID=1550035 RepID=UPI000780C80D|nr:NUDIX domain-containing protein [Streptomyces sp. NBRC 109706]
MPHTTIVSSPLPITFAVLALVPRSGQVLMVRRQGRDGWTLPAGRVLPGRCLILTARETLLRGTGYDRAVSETLAVSMDTDDSGTLTSFSYVLDGGSTPELPRYPRRLPEGAAWLPLRELGEPPALVQQAIVASAQGRRLPLLVNATRPNAAFS